MCLRFIDDCRSACRVPHSVWTQPIDSRGYGISQVSPSEEALSLPILGDETLFFLFPPFPRALANLFGRETILEDLLSLAEQSTSVSLFGMGGMGKTAIALTLLHHHHIINRFNKHRYFIRCDNLENSLDDLLRRLSEAIGFPQPAGMAQLLSHLGASPPCILVLDGIDSILDPLAPGAVEVIKTIEEFGRCSKICLLTTSRIDAKIPDFRGIEVSTFPKEAARNTFYSYCSLDRSVVINNILAELDFHPLSITLLASATSENEWDEPALLEAWNDGKTCILKASGRESLGESIESILRTPTIQGLGITARETLEAIADVPDGVKEMYLLNTFPGINGVGEAVDELCKSSLIYRQDGFLKMLSPFRLYFQHTRRITNPGLSLSFILFFYYGMKVLDGFPLVSSCPNHPTKAGPAGQTAWWEHIRAMFVSLILSFGGLRLTICS